MKFKKKLLFVVNPDWAFLSHRLPIAKEAINKGYEVHLATKITLDEKIFSSENIIVHNIRLSRSITNFITLIKELLIIINLYRRVNPDIVHLISIKPVIFGLISSLIIPKSKFIVSIIGLGYIFSSKGLFASIRRAFISLLYKIAFLIKTPYVIFQNSSDKNIICSITSLKKNNLIILPGSGVNLNKYKFSKIPNGKPILFFGSRLLISKGLKEFINASKSIDDALFVIMGRYDTDSKECIDKKELNSYLIPGRLEYWGYKQDIITFLEKSSIVILPSFYGEGLPKILIEAASIGRPIITTNHPGCRDAIIDGKTGILIKVKDTQLLIKAIRKIISNRKLMEEMGKNAHSFAHSKFDIRNVIKEHIRIYNSF